MDVTLFFEMEMPCGSSVLAGSLARKQGEPWKWFTLPGVGLTVLRAICLRVEQLVWQA
jgi:hypothetical protein